MFVTNVLEKIFVYVAMIIEYVTGVSVLQECTPDVNTVTQVCVKIVLMISEVVVTVLLCVENALLHGHYAINAINRVVQIV